VSNYRRNVDRTFRRCEVFYQTYGERLSPKHKKLLVAATRIRHTNWFIRRYLIIRHGFFRTGLLKNAGLLAVV